MFEDDPGWDCHTMGNRDCGDTHYTSGDHDAGVGHAYGWTPEVALPDTSMQEVPSGLPLDGIGLIVVLFATLIFRRNRTR